MRASARRRSDSACESWCQHGRGRCRYGIFEHGDAPQRARVIRIRERGRMQQRRVVPYDDVADTVLEAEPVLWLRRVRREFIEQITGFVIGHAEDAERTARYRVQRLASGDRM